MDQQRINQLARVALDCSFRVHTALGAGLLESAYKACLAFELTEAGPHVQVEAPVALVYAGQKLADVGYRIDLLVEGALVPEIKALEAIAPVHKAQLLSYLRLADKRLGLLLNFNVMHLRDGIWRVANNL